MRKVIRITESHLENIIRNNISEVYQHQRDETVDFSKIDAYHEYDVLNKLLFGNKLPRVSINYSYAKSKHGSVKVRRDRFSGETTVVGMTLSKFLSVPYHIFQSTLAHEMIHVYQAMNNVNESNGGHGPVFHREMNRINAMNPGFKVTVTLDISDLKVAPTVKGKKMVAMLFQLDGNQKIAVLTPKAFETDKGQIDSIYNYNTRNGKYKKVVGDFYLTELPELLLKHVNRNIRSLAFSKLEDNELANRIKQGQHLGHFESENGETKWS